MSYATASLYGVKSSGPFSESLYAKFNGSHQSEALLRFVCGPKLGRGIAREVFEYASNDGFVIKFANGSAGVSQNLFEFETWQQVRFTEFAKWFAPVHSVSPCGNILIMKKARPLRNGTCTFETEIPAFFTDLKASNFGRIGRQIVAVDYGLTLLMQKGLTKRMQKVKFYVE